MSEEVTPDPIPNSEVKLLSADDSSNAKVGRCLDNILSFLLPDLFGRQAKASVAKPRTDV